MRTILKGPEPRSLTQHRANKFSDFGNYSDKDQLREHLVREQKGVCCYCMGRISIREHLMKIEHWHCQERYRNEQLIYGNMLGACLGGEGQPRKLQHCDTRKGQSDLKWNPANPEHHIETRIKYDLDGHIRSDDSQFNNQLNYVLNLNLPLLKNNRKGVLSGVLEWWKANKPLPTSRIQNKIQRLLCDDNLIPYCQIAIWWLQKKISKRLNG